MKAICSIETKVEGDTITITGKIINVTYPVFVGQRTTMMHPVAGNPHHPRHIQVNTHGVLVSRNGKTDGVLFPKDELASMMLEIDEKLTDAPVFVAHPTVEDLKTAKAQSELPMVGKFQHSDDGQTWHDTELHPDFKPVAGKHYRCVAKSKAGETVSNIVKVPAPK